MRRIQHIVLALAAAAMPGILLSVPAAGQTVNATATKTAKTYTPPRTPWGDPDLQGVWPGTAMNGVPLERPQQFGTRASLTEQEFAQKEALAKKQAEIDAAQYANHDPLVIQGDKIIRCDDDPEQCADGVRIGPPRYWDERGKPSLRTSLIVDPPDGRIPPVTLEARKEAADRAAAQRARPCYSPGIGGGCHDSWEDESIYDRCITRGLVGSILPGGYDRGNQIVQGPGYVVIRNEMIHEARVVPLDGRPHLSSTIRNWMGDSRGHWEGNTLVVETTNFLGGDPIGRSPVSSALKVTERFTRTDADTLDYQAVIDDPKTWTKPWTIDIPFKHDPSYQLYEYACHEGNYYMYNALTGARAQEKKAAVQAK